jgi:hypothetical protein
MLKFIDCPHCGKRIRVQARYCYRCTNPTNSSPSDKAVEDQEEPTEHFAATGYADDDFDYDAYIEDEFESRPSLRKRFWYYVTWIVIVLMLLSSLMILQFAA